MKQLPVQLEPWRVWLTLLAPDLVDAVGTLLLRLNPLVGKLVSSARNEQDAPAGVGDIVLRGNFERLLMSEWLIADAEPDEFLRRAANNELLFAGPEPAVHKRSRQCIALFDVGPAQLGEPRLAHLALFILLARRAEEAGAQFLWGVLQMPGKLTADVGGPGLRALFGVRTLAAPGAADVEQWSAALAEAGDDASDNWLIGGAGACALAAKAIPSRIGVRRDLLQPRLHVELTQRRSERRAVLALPEPDQAVRLLREPFRPVAPLGRVSHAKGRPSLKQAPRFSLSGGALAVPQVDGGIAVYHVPQSPRVRPGKVRMQTPVEGEVLAVFPFKKQIGFIVAQGQELLFSNISGTHYGTSSNRVARPHVDLLQAPAGLGRWLQMYYFHSNQVARVCVLDQRRSLVAWSFVNVRNTAPSCDVIAKDVLGAFQMGDAIVYARLEQSHTRIYRWDMATWENKQIGTIPVTGREAVFAGRTGWDGSGHGLLAVQVNDTEWWMGTQMRAQIVNLPDAGSVLGISSGVRSGPDAPAGGEDLVVLQSDRKKIYRFGKEGRTDLVDCPAGIAQAVWNQQSGYLAWITNHREMFVRRLDVEQPLLHVVHGVIHDE